MRGDLQGGPGTSTQLVGVTYEPEPQDRIAPGAATRVTVVLPLAVWLAGALVFFRAVWTSGFRHLTGNDGDTRLIAFLCEHWFRVLHGQEAWRNMPLYYPVKGLLGWSDAFFLYEIFYAPLRELGAGPFLALQITQMLLSLVGFLGFFYLARRWFPSTAWIALAGALTFTFANNLYIHADSTQLSGVYIVPLILLAATRAWDHAAKANGTEHRRQRTAAAGWGALAGVSLGLLFFSTYYLAAFTVLATGVAAAWLLLLTLATRKTPADRWKALLWAAIPAALGLGAALVPVAVTYLPAHKIIGNVSRAEVLSFAVGWRSIGNFGSGNFVWSAFVRAIHSSTLAPTYESTYAVTPVLAASVVLGALWLARRTRLNHPAVALALTTVTLMVLPVKWHGHSLWMLVRIIPGYDAIRAIDRVEIVTGLVASLALMAVAAEVFRALVPVRERHRIGGPARKAGPMHAAPRTTRNRAGLALLSAVLAVIVLEQYDTSNVTMLNRPAQDRLLGAVPKAPRTCRYFYVVDTGNPGLPFYESQIDAMFIADRVDVPTINGYTGYDPKGWHLGNIGDPSYPASVLSWENEQRLGAGACRLDLTGMRWSPG